MKTVRSNQFSIFYAPEAWSFARKFLAFAGPPFVADSELVTGTSAAVTHREKYELFSEIANDLIGKLEDQAEKLKASGYSDGQFSRASAAIVEAMVSELYSMLDGLRRATFSAYRGKQGIQNKSTMTLFQRAATGVYVGVLPANLMDALSMAYRTWFPKLRLFRSETTR